MRYIARIIFFKALDWKIRGKLSPDIKKCVLIVAPHTSWHDFYLGLLVRQILGLQINYFAKKELFRPPFGWYFRSIGGIALDRTSNQKKVEAIADVFRSKDVFRLALSPEGTRKKTEKWKTGFYYIAREANVPIIMIAFDYGNKEVKVSKPFYPTENIENDLKEIFSFYEGVTGKIPEYF